VEIVDWELVHVAGNAVLDVLVRDAEIGGEAADRWGSNVQLLENPVEATLGGCGAAPAFLLGRLGLRVRLNTNLGDDCWGAVVKGWLREGCVELCGSSFTSTAVHVIALDRDRKRRSFYFTGEKLEWRRSLEEEIPGWLLASGYGKVDADDLAEMRQVFAAVRDRGGRVMFDPSPWFAGRVRIEEMREAWKSVDCLVATEEELRVWVEAGDAEDLAEQVLDLGPDTVVVKRGADGAAFAARNGVKGRLPTERIDRANSVGAGDTFNGRLLYGFYCREGLEKAVGESLHMATNAVRNGRGVLGALE